MPVSQGQPVVTNGPVYPLVPPSPADGEPIYAEKCAPCHGTFGLGDGPQAAQLPNPVAALGSVDVARGSTPAEWYIQVTKGNLERFMPPFGSLSDRQRWDVVAYAFSLSMPPESVNLGETLYKAGCAGCHGEQGRGDGPDASGLTLPDLTDQAFMAGKSDADFFQAISRGIEPGMPAFGDQFSQDEIWALSSYLRALTFSQSASPLASQVTIVPETPPGTIETLPAPATDSGLLMGTITGQVINASEGVVPEELTLTLHGIEDMQAVLTQTVGVQADGSFAFENVEMPVGRAFIITTSYADTAYSSDIGIVEEGTTTLNLPLEIYDTTTDSSILVADRLHLFFEFLDDQTLRVIQLYVISNPTSKTLVPGADGEPAVRFILPEGATNLEFQDGALGGRYVETENGFGDMFAVPPGAGSYEVLYAFTMPYDRKLDLAQPVSIPVDAVVILIPEDGVKIKSDTLVDGGTRDVQGAKYHLYNGSNLMVGDTLRMSISGRPTTGQPTLPGGSTTNIVIGLGVFGLALILAGVWLYSRTRKIDEDEEAKDELLEKDSGAEEENTETLIDAIIALDDLFQAGELPEEAYLKRRAELKARLEAQMGS